MSASRWATPEASFTAKLPRPHRSEAIRATGTISLEQSRWASPPKEKPAVTSASGLHHLSMAVTPAIPSPAPSDRDNSDESPLPGTKSLDHSRWATAASKDSDTAGTARAQDWARGRGRRGRRGSSRMWMTNRKTAAQPVHRIPNSSSPSKRVIPKALARNCVPPTTGLMAKTTTTDSAGSDNQAPPMLAAASGYSLCDPYVATTQPALHRLARPSCWYALRPQRRRPRMGRRRLRRRRRQHLRHPLIP